MNRGLRLAAVVVATLIVGVLVWRAWAWACWAERVAGSMANSGAPAATRWPLTT